jgi:hypothetical protein
VRPNYSLLRQEPRPAEEFDAELARAGLRRVDDGPQAQGPAVELWVCQQP